MHNLSMVFLKINEKKAKVDRTSPFAAQLALRLPLTKSGSTKATFHLTLDIEGSGLLFKVGDSLGIYGQNDPLLVDRILKTLSASGDECIVDPKSALPISLRNFLLDRANIGRSNGALLHLLRSQH